MKVKSGQLRVWHIPQIPGAPFLVKVQNVAAAKLILDSLAHYDLFQLEHNIKPDFSNAQGLEVFNAETQDWEEWYDADGDDIQGRS